MPQRRLRFQTQNLIDLFENPISMEFLNHENPDKTDYPPQSYKRFVTVANFPNLETIATEYRNLDYLVRALKSATRKFNYLRTTSSEWRKFYILPDNRTFQRRLRGHPQIDQMELHIINRTDQSILNWLEALLASTANDDAPANEQRKVTYLLGKVGCGKSSFLKYLCHKYFKLFHELHVIPSRVECKKLKRQGPNDELKSFKIYPKTYNNQ